MHRRLRPWCAAWFALMLILSGCPTAQMSWLVDTPLSDAGRPVRLEIVLFRPRGDGPFLLVIVNHGSTGRGDNPDLLTRTWAPAGMAEFFVQRGWMVAFPQRRGRGLSQGCYDEGFTPDRSRDSCDPRRSLTGIDYALESVDAAYHVLTQRPDVDRTRVLVAGQSRGGILAIVFAGRYAEAVVGVINFVGGWMSERCEAGAMNRPACQRGAPFPRPTLWL